MQETKGCLCWGGDVEGRNAVEGLKGNLQPSQSLFRVRGEMLALWLPICSDEEVISTKMNPGCKVDCEEH